ncbi:MAG: ribbon-helix-helix protein, CopG family [Opitutaceae bacterium]|nr:ribbon-helix-helix protein, CopG family [Opitutaceae bacterium]
MASQPLLASTPLTFELPRALVDRIQSCRRGLGLKSVSDVIRRALDDFDFATFNPLPREQCQISVRLSPAGKRILFHHARRKKVSAGVLLRSALEALLPRPSQAKRGAPARKAAGNTARKQPARKKRK